MAAKRSTIDIVKVLERWAAVAIAYAPIPRGMKRPRDTAIIELYNALAQAHQQIEGLEFTWIPCEERMPAIGQVVKCYAPDTPSSHFLGHRLKDAWARNTVGTRSVLKPNWRSRLFVGIVTHWAEIRFPEPHLEAMQAVIVERSA